MNHCPRWNGDLLVGIRSNGLPESDKQQLGPISSPFRGNPEEPSTRPQHPTRHVRTVRCRTPNTKSISDVVQRLAASTGLVAGDTLAGRDVDIRFRIVRGDAAAHTLLDLTRHRQEGLLNVACVLG